MIDDQREAVATLTGGSLRPTADESHRDPYADMGVGIGGRDRTELPRSSLLTLLFLPLPSFLSSSREKRKKIKSAGNPAFGNQNGVDIPFSDEVNLPYRDWGIRV